jgi:hypothetical protein
MPTTVIYHADCLDGFAAAYAAWRRFGDTAHYLPLHHGEPWDSETVAGHQVFVLDFSFLPEQLESIARLAAGLVQIDHHLSAMRPWRDRLLEQPGGTREFRHPELPLTVVFALDKSGARLAWEHFLPDHPLPLPLFHIEDQDLWRFADPQSKIFCRAWRLLPFEFAAWHRQLGKASASEQPGYQRLLDEGLAIEHFFANEIEHLAQGQLATPARLRGEPADPLQAMRHDQATVSDGISTWQAVTGLAINANALFSSELGHRLALSSGSFGLTWQLAADGEIKASLRSEGSFDVSAIATRYGGGGHRNAAGFRMSAVQFLREVLQLG